MWQTLAALGHAFRRLSIGNEGAFEVVDPEDPQPFLGFLRDCVSAHGAEVLAANIVRYRRFVFAVDPGPIVESAGLMEHLHGWQPAFEKWLAEFKENVAKLNADVKTFDAQIYAAAQPVARKYELIRVP